MAEEVLHRVQRLTARKKAQNRYAIRNLEVLRAAQSGAVEHEDGARLLNLPGDVDKTAADQPAYALKRELHT